MSDTNDEMTDEQAEVVLSMGRWHLKVNGVILATEGDICRQWGLPALWEKATIVMVANITNSGYVPDAEYWHNQRGQAAE